MKKYIVTSVALLSSAGLAAAQTAAPVASDLTDSLKENGLYALAAGVTITTAVIGWSFVKRMIFK